MKKVEHFDVILNIAYSLLLALLDLNSGISLDVLLAIEVVIFDSNSIQFVQVSPKLLLRIRIVFGKCNFMDRPTSHRSSIT